MMMIDRAVALQALKAMEANWYAVADQAPHGDVMAYNAATEALRAAVLAQQDEPKVEGGPPPPWAVPPEVAATLTSTDIAWLQTHRLTKIWQELGQMRWVGADHGWDLAIKAVRRRLNDECQDVLDWKAQADQSGATAVELLQKVQGLRA